MRARVGIVLGLSLLLASRGAHADPSPEEAAVAREQFKLGLEAVDASDWDRARDAFQRSYDAWPRPLTLLNLAGAQARGGKLVASATSYRSFLRVANGPAAAQRPAAEEALADVERRTPHVTLRTSTPLVVTDTLLVDGAPLAIAQVGLPLPVDPGAHAVRVARGGKSVAETTFTMDEAESKEVTLVVPPRIAEPAHIPSSVVAPAASPDPPRDWARLDPAPQPKRGLVSSPWFWGVTVLVVGGAATALVFATGS